jgi:hypothetical protein
MTSLRSGPDGKRGTLWQLPVVTRRLLLLGPPLVLTAFTVLHPRPDHTSPALVDASTWFAAYHMIQLGLLGLVAVSVFLLADDFRRASAWPTCLGMGLFLVFFSAYDTLAGIGTGLAMNGASELPAAQQQVVFDIVEGWPVAEPSVVWLSLVGTFGWVLALGYLAAVARSTGASRAEWVLLGLAAFFLMLGHPAPFGTVAFGSLFIALLIGERRAARVPHGGRAADAVLAGKE